jgi:tight adherence protein B
MQLGGKLPRSLDRIVKTMVERARVEGKFKALTAQGRAQATLVSAVGPLIFIYMRLFEPEKARALTETLTGQILLVAAILLIAIGVGITIKMLRMDI